MPGLHRADLEFLDGQVPLATLTARAAARGIDLLIVFVVTYLPFMLLIESTGGHLVALYGTFVLYDAMSTAKTGASPGKRMGRIKVVEAGTGAPPGWGPAVVRAVTLGVSVWIIAVVSAFEDEARHRGVHDRLAGTVVVAS